MSKEEKLRKKIVKEIEKIAKGSLRVRNKYPSDSEHFRLLCGAKETKVFYDIMDMLNKRAERIGYNFEWYYNQEKCEWVYNLFPL